MEEGETIENTLRLLALEREKYAKKD